MIAARSQLGPAERPILFSAPMVRAILAGKKMQTRRIATVPWHKSKRALPYEPYYVEDDGELLVDCDETHGGYREFSKCQRCPYGAPGEWLWVRETFAALIDKNGKNKIAYRADGDPGDGLREQNTRWRPSIFMPRYASRITLEVLAVRVERLHEIRREDALAEGVDVFHGSTSTRAPSPRDQFMSLWDTINGKRAPWASNPWVWVVEFERLHAMAPAKRALP